MKWASPWVVGCLFAIGASPARGQERPPADPSGVRGVVVEFSDGRQQRFAPASESLPPPPATAPTTTPSGDGGTPQETPAPGGGKSLLGVNLEGLKDYTRSKVFIDAMKTSRAFGAPDKPWSGSDKIPLDADGWPLADAGVVVMTEAVNASGVYQFHCVGRCVPKAVGGSPVKVRNVHYDERTDRTSAEVLFNAKPDKPSNFFLALTGTSGGVRNVKLLRPGYADDAQVFTNEFLRALEPFGTLRFMDWLDTNSSPIVRWQDRAKPTDAQLTIKGGTYEHAIELGNRTGKDVWLHVPALADDAFIEELAKLVRARLKPDVRCYLEYSNEVWNGQFKQHRQNHELAKAEVEAGERTLNDDGRERNGYYWGFRRVGKRTVEIGQVFDRVFERQPGQPRDPRIRLILAGQLVNPTVIEQALLWIERYAGGHVSDHIYAVSAAPYFGHKKDLMQHDDLTVDDVVGALFQSAPAANNQHVQRLRELALKHGVKPVAYEGGVDLGQYKASLEAKVAAQADPRAGEAVGQYLSHWFDAGGDLFMYYNLCTRYSRYGYWGLTDDIAAARQSPKYQAAADVAARVPQPSAP